MTNTMHNVLCLYIVLNVVQIRICYMHISRLCSSIFVWCDAVCECYFNSDNNLCMYCGQSGHWATNCPHKRQKLNTAIIESVPASSTKPEVLYSVEAKNL